MVDVFGQSVPFSLLLLLAGTALVVAEALAPGAHFIVLGVALLVAGLVGLLLGPVLPEVVIMFVLAAVVIVTGAASLYAYRQFDFYRGEGSGRTSDSASLRGKTGRVTERVTESGGEVKLDGGGFNPYYRARAFDNDIDVGEKVIVVDPGGGNVLTVESMANLEDDIDRELARGQASREADHEREVDRDRERDPDPDTA